MYTKNTPFTKKGNNCQGFIICLQPTVNLPPGWLVKKLVFILGPLAIIGAKYIHSDCLYSMSGCICVGHTDVSMLLYGYKILLSYHTKQHTLMKKKKSYNLLNGIFSKSG